MILLLGTIAPWVSAQVSKAPVPEWVTELEFNPKTELDEDDLWGGTVDLLYDRQIHVEKEVSYLKVVRKFTDSEGVEEFSDFSVDFDPSYQKVVFHEIKIHRDGLEIDKLNAQKIQTLQRETDLERHIYDGSETALVSLSDVRVGDIVEYSYSVKGRNPIHQGKFFGTWYVGMYSPVSEMHLRFVTSPNRKIKFKGHPEPLELETGYLGNERTYTYQAENIRPPEWEVNVPAWVNLYPRIEATEMGSWGEVVRWALPQFQIGQADEKAVSELIETMPEGRKSYYEHGTDYTKWVQNEIRYLGLESGIGSYKPRAPAKVIKDRFGDCKDKSLLLSTMLQQQNIKAWPMLVESTEGRMLPEMLPSPVHFNHCVVYVETGNDTFVVDPTINLQGGALYRNVCA